MTLENAYFLYRALRGGVYCGNCSGDGYGGSCLHCGSNEAKSS